MGEKRGIFITGFPGFIAGRLLELLATKDREIFLLVQPGFVDKAIADIDRIARLNSVPLENFAIIEGDITGSDLGITPDDHDALRDQITDVFHLAAVYDLAADREIAFAVNLEGTKNVNNFVLSLRGLRRYNYVSTCYVAGKRTGVIREDELIHGAGFRNFYEESKYLAELEVEKLKADLPVTIFRPSVVMGDSGTGETAKYDGIYYLILYLLKAPSLLRLVNVGNRKVRLNLVPVDFVVKGITALVDDELAIGKTVALADPSPLRTSELFDILAKDLTGKGSIAIPPAGIVERFLSSSVSPGLTGLPLPGVPYFFLEQTYDTATADKLLAPHGIECPRFGDYSRNLLDFVKKHPVNRS